MGNFKQKFWRLNSSKNKIAIHLLTISFIFTALSSGVLVYLLRNGTFSPKQVLQATSSCSGVDTMIAIDVSGSISGSELQQRANATKAFIDALARSPGARAGVIRFGSVLDSNIDVPLTTNMAQVKAGIDAIPSTNQSSCVDCGILFGGNEIHAKLRPGANRSVILLTDGNGTRTWGATHEERLAVPANQADAVGLAHAKEAYARDGTHYHTVAIGSRANFDWMAQVAQATGGKALTAAKDMSNLSSAFNQILTSACTGPAPTPTPAGPTATPTPSPTPTPTPIPTYNVSGSVFIDTNKNARKDTGEGNYSGTVTVSATSGSGSPRTSTGNYTIAGLLAGTYTVSYTPIPAGYFIVYPLTGPPPTSLVTVGPGCSVSAASGATCSGGSVTNLNFAISNSIPWIQTYGLDIRFDNGLANPIPQAPTCPAYASAQDTSSTTPGIVFTGDTPSDFGRGQASTTNWVVGGTLYPEVYAPVGQSQATSSYTHLLLTSERLSSTPVNLATICTLSNCILPPNLPNGVYQANGNLTLNTYNFANNRNYIFLINGTFTIRGPLTVTPGSTAIFSAAQDIIVDRTVGAAANICPITTTQLEGYFSADRNFIVDGINDCVVGRDRMLNVGGAVIANARRMGGNFINRRDLCGDNFTTPSFTISPRLDQILNLPAFIMKHSMTFTEVVP